MKRLAILTLVLPALVTIALGDLNYVESSSGFQSNPVLDGGRSELELADIDNDGNIDILSIGDHGSPYVNTQEHGVMVWFGDGDGGWSVFQYGDFGYGGIAVGDMNGDGLWDVGYGMHHPYSSNDLGNQLLEVALGDGTGRMWTPWDDSLMPAGACWGMHATDFGDIDNDGDLDVASASFGSGVGLRVYRNLGDGSWGQTFATPGSTNSTMECYLRDVNRDGNLDAIAALGLGSVWLGDGTGGFVPASTGLPMSHYGLFGISPGDVDNDGGCDVAFANLDGGVEVYVWNDQAQSWEEFSGSLPDTGDFNATELCDMDADGFIDVLAFGSGLLKVWTGDGLGNWTEAATAGTPPRGSYAALRTGADFDHNGRPDIVLWSREGTWPNDFNVAHAFKETSPAESLNVFPVFPRGGEKFIDGSVQFIDWWSAAPDPESTMAKLELSLAGRGGPWQAIADSLPNAGRYQWSIPESIVSGNCFVRYTVFGPEGTAIALTARPFAIGDTMVGIQSPPRPYPDTRLSLAPNPARTRVVLSLGHAAPDPIPVSFYDAGGRLVLHTLLPRTAANPGNRTAIDIRALPTGVYYVRADRLAPRRLVKVD